MKKILLEQDNKKNSLSEKLDKHPKVSKYIIFGMVFFLITFSLEIWIVNRLSTYGDKIQELKIAEAKLELENQIIANSIAKDSSMVTLEKKATELGFSSINQIEYIKISNKLASAE